MASPAPEQLLSNLDPKASQNASIDIVLVAGIGTPECKKWPFDNFEWLAANLPSGIHVLRVLRFEQISWKDKKFSWEAFVKEQGHQLSEKINTACLEDGKNSRPVLYVCHSLGGMLLKKCIDIARHRNGRTDQLFLDTIAAILFISTPHRHPQKTKTHELFREVFEAINGNSIKWEKNAKTDEGKKHDNEVLVKLADRFDDSFPNKKILYTYETTPKPVRTYHLSFYPDS